MTSPTAHREPAPRATPRPRPPSGGTGYDRLYLTAFLLALIAPPELQFRLGTLVLSPQRVFLILAFFPALSRVASDRRIGFRAIDLLVLAHVLWAWVAVAQVHGIEFSIQPGGIYVIECLGGYVVGRALMHSVSNIRHFVRRQVLIVGLLMLFTIPEAVTHRHYIRDTMGAIFGGQFIPRTDERLGLTRAFGPFDHPILYGVFCASALGFAWYLAPTRRRLGLARIRRAVMVIVAAFVSVSSGPLLACTAQVLIIGWDVVTRGIQKRWWMLLSGLAFIYVMLESLSNRGALTVFISYLTFNPTTGYNRKMIWQWGMEEVRRNPIFGIGFNEWSTPPHWWHGSSVDAFWLVTAMRYGYPGAILLIAVCLWTVIRVTRIRHPALQPIAMAWIVSFLGLSIAAVATHLWGSMFVLFSFLLGFGVTLSSLRPPAPKQPAPTPLP